KGMANRVVGAKGHEPCGPRDKFSTIIRSRNSIDYLEYQPFFCSLKVKGTANRVVGAKGHEPCGPRDKFSTFFRSHNSIDYLEYQPFFVHSKSKARRIE